MVFHNYFKAVSKKTLLRMGWAHQSQQKCKWSLLWLHMHDDVGVVTVMTSQEVLDL